ncbi:MAG: hypothetical protein AAGH17_11550 [Pseudomonadota bacterium]
MKRTLLIILAFVAFMVGSFIWFVVTWDPTKEESVTELTTGTENDPTA